MSVRLGLVCKEPIVAIGIRETLGRESDTCFSGTWRDLGGVLGSVCAADLDVCLLRHDEDHSLGEIRQISQLCGVVVWGAISKEHAFQYMDAGVRGILPSDAGAAEIRDALEAVHSGRVFVDQTLAGEMLCGRRVPLTPREAQLVTLVSQGLKNKEIAFEMGIREGTVKVYVTKLLRKLDMNDRLELALFGLRNLFGTPATQGEEKSVRKSIVVSQWRHGGAAIRDYVV